MSTSQRGWLLISAAVLLAIAIIGLRAVESYYYRINVLRTALHQSIDLSDQFSENVRDHVTTIQLVAETYLQPMVAPSDRAVETGRGWSLPWLLGAGLSRFSEPGSPVSRLLQGTAATSSRGFQQEIDAALALSPLFRVIVDQDPHLRQAFYASLRGFAKTHPWWPAGMIDLGAGYLDLTLFDLGRPQVNPLRETYWLAPVDQRDGGGLAATMAAPVYDGDHFVGVVGLEISLAATREVVEALDLPFGTAFLVDYRRRVVASAGPAAVDPRTHLSLNPDRPVEMVDGLPVTGLTAVDARSFHFVDGHLVYRLPLARLPLSLVYTASIDQVLMSLAPTLAETLAVIGFVAVVLWLLGQRARAMRDSRESEQMFRLLAEMAPVGLALTRLDSGEIIAVNPVASELLAVDPEEAALRRSTEFYVNPADRQRLLAEIREKGAAINLDAELKSFNGRPFWSQISGVPTQLRRETVMLTSIVDVTDRRLAEQRLRLSEERHRAIFSTASVGIVLMDATGRFLQVNQAWCDMLGYGTDEARGLSYGDVVHLDEREAAKTGLDRLLAGQTGSLRQEIRFVRRSGSALWGDVTASVVRQADGRIEGVVGVILDITARRAYEAELVATRRRLEDQAEELRRTARHLSVARREAERGLMVAEQVNQAKSHFLAAMSHELRTPLNAILGFSELIRDRVLGAEALDRYAEYAADVHDSGSYLLDLINDILDISKIEAGKLEIDRAELDLRELLDSVLRLVRVRADSGRLTLDLEVADQAALIVADERAIKQIAFNLVSNAIKFTPPGGRIMIRAVADADGIHLSVIDSGIGIPPEELDRVTHPFEQLDNRFDRRSPFGGTGLGLSLVRALTELHGGQVRIDSTVNVGTRVTVSLPHECIPQGMTDPADRWTARAVG